MFCPNRWVFLEEMAQLDTWAISNERTDLATVRALNRIVGRRLGIAWHIGPQGDLSPGDATIGAEYDPAADEVEEPIYVDGYVSIGDRHCVWDHNKWTDFKRMVADTICHEHIHAHQYRKKLVSRLNCSYTHIPDSKERERAYLSDPVEIDAYAHNVAAELYDHYGLQQARAVLSDWKDFPKVAEGSPSMHLWSYIKAFGKKHQVIDSLNTRAQKYLVEIHRQYVFLQADNDH